jgi:RHS repeat-associated protein
MTSHQTAMAAGAHGLLFSVAGPGTVPGQIRVRISYASFASAYGGGYADRLALFAMPACALTTPTVRSCRGMTEVPSVNDARTGTITAIVTTGRQPGSSRTPGAVYALTSTTSGGTGDYKATSLAPSSLWQVGLQTGDFSWSYPLRVPPPIGGTAPSLALSYDSGATDGETAQDNSQPGQLGEGFSLSGGGGFIEQKYVSCGDVIKGTNDTNQSYSTGDECWDGQNAYLSSGGRAGQIIQSTSGSWHLSDDDGSTVTFVPGTNNCSDHEAETGSYWEVIAPDGTRYYYGLNQLPGYKSGNSETESVWTMPIFSLATGDPCFSSTYADSYASMPYRWNLDLVVDPNGNATSYYYSTETNYYATDSYSTSSGTNYGTALPYTSGGVLTDIWYGMQDNSSTSPDSGGNVYARKAFDVHFTFSDRCTVLDEDGSVDNSTCNANETQTDWPDTPWDLYCASASGCTGSGHDAPSFFDTQMLTGVTTYVEQGFNTPEAVDTWTLAFQWLAADVNSDLVLASISHTGDVGGSITLPPVSLGWTSMNNRVNYGETESNGDEYPVMQRYRLTAVTSETGAETDVTYNPASCSASEQTDPSQNTYPCFPQYWTGGDFGGTPTVLWFYKYTVAKVVVSDPANQDEPGMYTYYTYCNNAACSDPGMGAAWHYDTDIDLVPEKDKSYGEWRGYQYVREITGEDGQTQSETDYTFLRGMNGDPLPGGGTDTSDIVTPSDIAGTQQVPTSIVDVNALNGFQLEKITWIGLNGSSQGQLSDQVSWPWTATTATSATQPWGQPLTAVITKIAETDTYTPLSPHDNGGTAGTRQTQTVNEYNSTTGLLTQVSDLGDLSQPSQAVCSTYVYPSPSSTAGLLDYPAEVQAVNEACPSGSPALVPDSDPSLVSDTKYSYDGQANGVAPVSGNVTETDVYSSGDSSNSSPHWVQQTRDTYDSYGRLLSDENSKGYTTSHWYCSKWSGASPACPAPGTSGYVQGYATTQTSVTSPLTSTTSAVTTTDVDPEWGSPYDTIDAASQRTDFAYDALGRVTSVWLPGQTQSSRADDGLANYTYSYYIDPKKANPPYVTTTRITGINDVEVTSVEIFDSLLRPRQTQAPAEGPAGGMEVTDTFYDSRGNTQITNGPYTASATPSGTLWDTTEGAVPDETLNVYDGADRITSSSLYHDGALQWGTTWQYTGSDDVTEIPPSGGTITSTYTDARGRVTEIDQYHSKTQASGAYDATTYSYDPITGQLAGETDAGANQWSWTYDLLGRQLTATTPDTGTTTSTYDDLGELTSVKDGAGDYVSYKYDEAGRETAEYASRYSGQNAGDQLAAWTYDTAPLDNPALSGADAVGQLASATSYIGGTSGEAYTETIGGYDPGYQAAQVTYTIPRNSVTGALGGTTAGGSASYQFSYSYNADGTPDTLSYPASGPLAAETVSYGYTSLGNQSSLASSLADYIVATIYDPDAQPASIDLGVNTSSEWSQIAYSYDPASLRLTGSEIQNQTTGSNSWITDDDTSYTYDNSGNLTSAGDSVTGNYQCYQYDYLSRLTAAWAQASSGCPASAPTASGLGGPAPYEQTLSYDTGGQANGSTNGTTGTISGSTLITGSGPTAVTTATTYDYPGYGAAQPHAPTTQTTTVNGGTPATTTLAWTGSGSQPGYLASETGATNASCNWDGTGATPGQLYSATTSGTTTSYRYDASGNLLIVQDGGTSTLYLPGEEITATSTAITSATRYYTGDDQVFALRTATSSKSSTLDWLLPDPQGTATTLITSGSTPAATHRYYTPYGVLLGTVPSTSTWPGTRGYIGGTTGTTTGLTNLGAREYDPAAPSFMSPDPVPNPYEPVGLDPYDYAYNNPATSSDPTGQTVNTYQACASGDPYCGGGTYDNVVWQSYGDWTDLAGGIINEAFQSAVDSTVLMLAGPAAVKAVSSVLPQIPVGDPDTTLYGAGSLAAAILPAALGDDEAAAADLTADTTGQLAVAAAAEDAGADAADAGASRGPGFVARSNGEVIRVPEGASGPTPTDNGLGFQFRGGSGGDPLDSRVTGVRIMDLVTSGKYLYPNGYVSYENGLGQTVNPFTGQTIAPSDPFWHWALEP